MKNTKHYLKAVIVLATIGLLIFFNDTRPVELARAYVLRSWSPLISLASKMREKTELFFVRFGNYQSNEFILESDRIAALAFENEKLKSENETLRSALGFSQDRKVSVFGASVILYTKELGKEYLLLEIPKKDSAVSGFPVTDANGLLVGIIREKNNEFLKVEVISNAGLTFEAEVLPAKIKGISRGLGGRSFALELLPQDAQILPGDFVFYSQDKFNLPFGQITSVRTNHSASFREARIVLASHPEILKEVFIVLPQR